MAGPIVLGYDGSPCSKAALHETAAMARALGRPVIVTFGYAAYPVGGETRDQELLLARFARETVAEAVAYLRDAGLEVEAAIVHDRPAASLLDVVEQRDGSLIVVGTNGENPVIGAILGSVPQKLLHLAHVPVLVVPASAPADD